MNHEYSLNSTRVGILGTGAMAEALMRGMITRQLTDPSHIVGYDIRHDRLTELQHALGVTVARDLRDMLSTADVVVLAVKPQHMAGVLDQITPNLRSEQLFVSIAAGIPLRLLEMRLGEGVPVVRVMPNTPALVGKGISALSPGNYATEAHIALVETLLRAMGSVIRVDEAQLDAVTGLSGSGPAYLCLVIEALADGGVAAGLPRDVSLLLAAETVRGTGALVSQGLQRGEHPAVLRDRVTSPAGTTAAGLQALELAAVRAAFSQAVLDATARAKALGGA